MAFFCSDPDGRGCQMATLATSRQEAYGKGWRFGSDDPRRLGRGKPVCQDCRYATVRAKVAANRAAREAANA